MIKFLFILSLVCNDLSAQDTKDTLPDISYSNYDSNVDSVMNKYANILNSLTEKDSIPDFILNPCKIDLDYFRLQDPHLMTSLRWILIHQVTSRKTLMRIKNNKKAQRKCIWSSKNLREPYRNYSWSSLAKKRLNEL
jgi:hypothetical protein